MTNLLKLAERVEAGEFSVQFCRLVSKALYSPEEINYDIVYCALGDDLIDMARGIHDAVLPGWGFSIGVETASVWAIAKPKEGHGKSSNPAAAWVAAILRAKAQEDNA